MILSSTHLARPAVALLTVLSALAAGTTAFAQTPAPPTNLRVYAGSPSPPSVSVAVAPATASIQPGGVIQFTATVTGTLNTAVVWSSTGGTISSTGQYTAGQSAGTFRVTATVSGGTIAGSAAVTIQSSSTGTDYQVTPGQNIQSVINAAPEGAVILLEAGVHRMQTLIPRNRQTIAGEPGAILSGARLLTSFSREGTAWVASGQTQQGSVTPSSIGSFPVCNSAYPRCGYPEELYIDDVLLRHVSSLSAGGPGRWFFDYATDRIYFWDDPTGHRVETSVTTYAFGGSASGVTIRNLVIEKFANPPQSGALQGQTTSGWIVRENDIRFNHGIGLRIGPRMQVIDNLIRSNGQMGIGGTGDDVLVDSNEISSNNTAGFNPNWEAGASKFVRTNRLIARRNWVHHNLGPGLWTDIDNINTLYEDNLVEDNVSLGGAAAPGIFHEISYSAVIRNNTIRRNGTGVSWSGGGAGIFIAASGGTGVEIYGNVVENNRGGIVLFQEPRGSGAYGAWLVQNVYVHNNTVKMTAGETGFFQVNSDGGIFSRNNRFDQNTYHLGPNGLYFVWLDAARDENYWRYTARQDSNGTFIR